MPRPILERFFDEIAQRHDQAALVPDADHHIGGGDLLDPAEFVLDDDGVLEPDRLGHGDLHAGDQIAQHRPGGEPDREPDHARRREQADAVLADRLERHQRGRERDHDDQSIGRALQDAYLGDVLAGQQVVRGVQLEAPQIGFRGEMHGDDREPADQQDEGDHQHMADRGANGRVERRHLQRGAHHEHEERKPGRRASAHHQRREEGATRPHNAARDPDQHQMRQQRRHYGNNQDQDSGKPAGRPRQNRLRLRPDGPRVEHPTAPVCDRQDGARDSTESKIWHAYGLKCFARRFAGPHR